MGWYYYRRNSYEDSMRSKYWNVEELLQRKRLDGAPTTTTVLCIARFGDKMLKQA
jgi:hypothetical protein